MIFRLGFGIARSWRPEHRWRCVVVPVCSALAMIAVLGAFSLWNMAERQQGRVDSRIAAVSEHNGETDLSIASSVVWLEDRPIQVNWIAPAGSGETILPPGVAEMPDPGVSYLSPALIRLREVNSQLQRQFPDVRQIADVGLADRDELIAWVRPSHPSIVGSSLGGVRAEAFGNRNGPVYRVDQTTNLNRAAVRIVLISLIVLPGALSLVVAVNAGSSLREDRMGVMRLLGVPESWIFRLALVEFFCLATPAMLAAMGVWIGVSHWLTWLPVKDKHLVPGDLELSAMQVAIAMAGCVLVSVALIWQNQRARRPGPGVGHRHTVPSALHRGVRPLRFLPILAGFVLVAFCQQIGRENPELYWMLGVLLVFLSVPVALPVVGRIVGGIIAEWPGVAALLAGRRLQRDAVSTMRPFLTLGALATIAMTTFGVMHAFDHTAEYVATADESAVASVSWIDPDESVMDAQATVQAIVPQALVVAMSYQEPAGSLVLHATCPEVALALRRDPDRWCTLLQGSSEERLASSDLAIQSLGPASVVFDPTPATSDGGRIRLMLFATMPAEQLRDDLESGASLPDFTDLTIHVSGESIPLRSASSEWLASGAFVLIALLGVAALAATVDGAIVRQIDRRFIVAVGASQKRAREIEAMSFLAPFLSVVLLGTGVGLLNTLTFGQFIASPFPFGAFTGLLVTCVLVGIVGAGAVVGLADPAPSRGGRSQD